MSNTLFPCGNEFRPGFRPMPNPIRKPPPSGNRFIIRNNRRFGIPPGIPPGADIVPPFNGGPGGPGRPTGPAPPGGGINPGGGGNPTGPSTPDQRYTYYSCQSFPVWCPDGELRSVTNRCMPFTTFNAAFAADNTLAKCSSGCINGPSTGGDPCPDTVGGLLLYGEDYNIPTGVTPIFESLRNSNQTIGISDLTDSIRSSGGDNLFQQNSTLSRQSNLTYDPIRNILDYSNSMPPSYVQNTLYLNVLNTLIAKEIYYIINNYNNTFAWKEIYILGITYDKILSSLNSDLRVYLEGLRDVDGKLVDIEPIVYGIFNHIIKGTLSQVDVSYYRNLYYKNKNRSPELEYTKGELKNDVGLVFDYVNQKKMIADPQAYQEPQHQIEIARLKFLPTDIDVSVRIETIDEGEQLVRLDNAGLAFTDNDSAEDHVPLGEGDGYYILVENQASLVADPLETVLNPNEEALLLDTSLDHSYYLPLQDRKTALGLLGMASEFVFTVSSSLLNSELSSGYQETYEAKPKYYKLDLTSVEDELSDEPFVNRISARYVKVLTQSEREIHSRTYGAKVQKLNMSFDDPFIQYADRSSEISLSYNELTFRNFAQNSSPVGNSILLRSLPDAIIIMPTNSTEENPYNGYSILKEITETTVVREVEADTDIGRTLDSEINHQSLPPKYTYDYLGDFKFGLAGLTDSQNVLYVYDPNDFTQSFIVSGRPPVGKGIYDILENTINKKYSFNYLTWWDLYRRMTLLEFVNFISDAPKEFLEQLSKSWRGYTFKNTLFRGSDYTLNNLTEIDPTIEDRVILKENIDRVT